MSGSKTRLISHLIRQWLPGALVSLVIGMIGAMFSGSFAVLIFSGDLAGYLPAGIAIALLISMILRTTIGLMSSYPGMIADADALFRGVPSGFRVCLDFFNDGANRFCIVAMLQNISL